jgi:hypothetical protein
VSRYRGKNAEPVMAEPSKYQTDLLIGERYDDSEEWTPRVVVEFKLGNVTTHDALTYSAKAATHKSIHPYLRYGIVIGNHPGPVPRRIIRHGHQFDFMMTLASEAAFSDEIDRLLAVLREEVGASRQIEALLSGRSRSSLFQRKIWVSE